MVDKSVERLKSIGNHWNPEASLEAQKFFKMKRTSRSHFEINATHSSYCDNSLSHIKTELTRKFIGLIFQKKIIIHGNFF